MEWKEAELLKPNALSQMAVKTDSQDSFNQDIFKDDFSGTNNVSYFEMIIQDLLNLAEIDKCFLQEDEDRMVLVNNFHEFSYKVDTITVGPLPRIDDLENHPESSQFIDDSNDTRSELVNISVPKNARRKRSRRHGLAWTTPVAQGRKIKPKTENGSISGKCSHNEVQKPPQWRIGALGKRKSKIKDGPVPGKCSHCEVQKSPQWRIGPLGPNTLCNACGIRFRSGRLFPEYRPACSPTFSYEMHSNSTRKVLEMRGDIKMTQGS